MQCSIPNWLHQNISCDGNCCIVNLQDIHSMESTSTLSTCFDSVCAAAVTSWTMYRENMTCQGRWAECRANSIPFQLTAARTLPGKPCVSSVVYDLNVQCRVDILYILSAINQIMHLWNWRRWVLNPSNNQCLVRCRLEVLDSRAPLLACSVAQVCS